jgi:O-phospho-L-seryl-tRNASec:L-selenocysteinyl-tRNA synthase
MKSQWLIDAPSPSSSSLSPSLSSSLASSLSLSLSSSAIVNIAQAAGQKQESIFVKLLNDGTIPNDGLEESVIEYILSRLSSMDANNNSDTSSVGEREGRIFSSLVKRRNWGFSHGIGRSGSLTEIQPKAPGSTILYRITTKLLKSALKITGLRVGGLNELLIMPVATGMAISFVLKAIALQRPKSRYVLMPRIDQKSCIKCVAAANLQLIIIENELVGDELSTNLLALKMAINKYGAESIAAVLTTSSCFAPRVCDRLVKVGELLQSFGIPQIVNNAYGLQSSHAIHQINETIRLELPLTAIICSTDKNFMVPVGGSIIIAKPSLITEISDLYPGRASIAPILDLFITLLAMGREGYRSVLERRKDSFRYLSDSLKRLESSSSSSCPITVLNTRNDISIAIRIEDPFLGSQLFLRCVSGARVISPTTIRKVANHLILNFGAHHDGLKFSYLTVAAAIGQTRRDIDLFLRRLSKLLRRRPKGR